MQAKQDIVERVGSWRVAATPGAAGARDARRTARGIVPAAVSVFPLLLGPPLRGVHNVTLVRVVVRSVNVSDGDVPAPPGEAGRPAVHCRTAGTVGQ
eukprot:2914047-Prymnesium_polylepis.3